MESSPLLALEGDPSLRVLAQLKGFSPVRDPRPPITSPPWSEGDRSFVTGSHYQKEMDAPKHLRSV